MSSERKKKLNSLIKKILEEEISRFSLEELEEMEELLFKVTKNSTPIDPIFKKIYEIIKKKKPDEPTRRRRPR